MEKVPFVRLTKCKAEQGLDCFSAKASQLGWEKDFWPKVINTDVGDLHLVAELSELPGFGEYRSKVKRVAWSLTVYRG